MTKAENLPSARDLALRRLSVREYSGAEMMEYLRRRGVDGADAKEAVEELTQADLISDLRYARVIVRDQSFRDKGPMAMLTKLRRKGVRITLPEVKRIYAETTDQDELAAVQGILRKRFPDAATEPAEKRRAFTSLLRRGFSADVIKRGLEWREDFGETD